jgi:hypothetical protein
MTIFLDSYLKYDEVKDKKEYRLNTGSKAYALIADGDSLQRVVKDDTIGDRDLNRIMATQGWVGEEYGKLFDSLTEIVKDTRWTGCLPKELKIRVRIKGSERKTTVLIGYADSSLNDGEDFSA